MKEIEQLSSLIGDIYDAALDPSLWSAVLRKARAFVGGSAAALFCKDTARKDLDVYYEDGGLDPRFRQLYFEKYAALDPFTTGQVSAEIEDPVSTVDLLPYGEFVETPFHKEWAKPQLLVDFICAVLEKSATGAAMFGVFRHERDGLADEDARRRMRLIVPHIRRAVLIGRTMDLKAAEAGTFADMLDSLGPGLFLVDATGRIVHANASGHAMLQTRAVLRSAAGRLVAIESGAAAALNEVFALCGDGAAAVGTSGTTVPLRARDGACFLAHVLPLASGARVRAGASCAAVAAVFVHKSELEAPSPPEAIARFYKLTPSELRVLLAIVQVGGVPEAAQALGIGEATVKTHLHRLFGKTGTSRQADLVKLVAGFSHPLAGRPGNRAQAAWHQSIGGRGADRLSVI